MLNNLLELSYLDAILSRLPLWVRKVVSVWSLCSKQETYGPAHRCGNYPLEFPSLSHWLEADQGNETDVWSELGRIQVLWSLSFLFWEVPLMVSASHSHVNLDCYRRVDNYDCQWTFFVWSAEKKIRQIFWLMLILQVLSFFLNCGAYLASDHLIDFTFNSRKIDLHLFALKRQERH